MTRPHRDQKRFALGERFLTDPDDITANYHRGNPRSTEAYQRSKRHHQGARTRIAELMRRHPRGLISDEAELLLGMRHQSCSARFSEMKRDGVLVLTGERRKTTAGDWADVHALPRLVEER